MAKATGSVSPLFPEREPTDFEHLAEKLARLEGCLSAVQATEDAVRAVRGLVSTALHSGSKATPPGEVYDPSSVYWMGFQALEAIVSRLGGEIVEACGAFTAATQGDAVVGPYLDALHAKTPMGAVWTGEEYLDR